MSVYNDESNSNTSNNSNNSQPTQIKEQSTQSKSSEQTISEEYYSSLPNVPPPPPPQPHSALQEYSLPTTRQGGAASLLSISINRDANEDEEADVPKSVSGASLSSPSITHLAQPSLLDRSFSSSMRVSNNSSSSGSGSSSGSSSTVGSLGRNQSPRFALRNMGSLIHNNTTISSSVSVSGSNTFSRGNHSVSSSTSGILDLNSLIHEKPITMDDSSSSTSPSAASGLSRLSSRPIVIGHVSQSQPSSPTPAIAQLPISPPSLPKVSERAESPTSQGPALTVIELDKEREEEERRRKEAERDNEAKKKLELKGRLSFRKDPTTHAQSATITIPTQTSLKKDKHKYLSMLQMRKTVIFNEKNTVGTPVASNLEFKAMLELPESKHIKSTIDSFIKGFEKKTKGNPDEEVKNTKLLITATENSMRHHVLWSKLPQNYFVIAKEEMQKYIYTRLYNMYAFTHSLTYPFIHSNKLIFYCLYCYFFFFCRIFAKKEYEEKDKWIKKHIEEIRPYLTPQFLELKESYYNNDTLQAAITELNLFESDDFITPREKITAIFNSCRILNCKWNNTV